MPFTIYWLRYHLPFTGEDAIYHLLAKMPFTIYWLRYHLLVKMQFTLISYNFIKFSILVLDKGHVPETSANLWVLLIYQFI